MLEDKIFGLKELVGNVKLKTVAYVLAAGASLLPVYGCGDECEIDADCPKGEVCIEECEQRGKGNKDGSYDIYDSCHFFCKGGSYN